MTGEKKAGGMPPAPSYSAFHTTFPSVVGDPSLMPLLEAHRAVVDVATPSPPCFAILLTNGLPVLLLALLLRWIRRQAPRKQSRLFLFRGNKSRRYPRARPH